MPDPIDVQVGVRLRLRRILLGMTQEKLAGAIGVTFQQVQKYERGTVRIAASRLAAFGRALDVPVSYFFAEAEARDETAPAADPAIEVTPREMLDLATAFARIADPKLRLKILGLIRTLGDTRRD